MKELKLCRKCDRMLPLSDFYSSPGRRPSSPCKGCHNAEGKRRYREHPDPWMRAYEKKKATPGKIRDHSYRTRYGLSLDEYEAWADRLGRRCEICSAVCPPQRYRRLQVDHNHATGRVRGLLCPRCNRLLGAVNDDVVLLRSLIAYLEERP